MTCNNETDVETPSADEDFGCGWSVTNLLCGLYAQSAPPEEDSQESLPRSQPAMHPLIYRVA